MGHSVSRSTDEALKIHKRLELLPEEALYLVERGTLFCTKESRGLTLNVPGMDDIEGVPMSVQQAFAEMIGSEGLTLEKYQVSTLISLCYHCLTCTLGLRVLEAPRILHYPHRPAHIVVSVCPALCLIFDQSSTITDPTFILLDRLAYYSASPAALAKIRLVEAASTSSQFYIGYVRLPFIDFPRLSCLNPYCRHHFQITTPHSLWSLRTATLYKNFYTISVQDLLQSVQAIHTISQDRPRPTRFLSCRYQVRAVHCFSQ